MNNQQIGGHDYGRHENTRMANPIGFGGSIEDNVAKIKKRYPEASKQVIREELKRTNNDVAKTCNTLKALVNVAKLRKEFPKLSPDVVAHVLKDCGGDYDEAAAKLAQLVLDYHKMKLEKKKKMSLKKEKAKQQQQQQSYQQPPQQQSYQQPPQQRDPGYQAVPQQVSQPKPRPAELPPPLTPQPASLPPPPAAQSQYVTQARALYDYATEQEAKLDFKKGEVINVTNNSGDAWWYGEIHGKQGKFPKTYVRELNEEIKATALYDFGDKEAHLHFKRDNTIILLNKRKGSQWWEGILDDGSTHVGIFPINYVNVTDNLELFSYLQSAEE